MFIIGTDFILIYFINRVLVPDSFVGLIFVNMKTLKMKVKPYTKEQNHLELILRPKERDNWLQALINDDSQSVKSILSKCGSGEKKNYLNGCFEVSEDEKASDKSRCRIGLKNRDTKESFSHSLHMAAAFGSHQTVTSLIKHECNVFVTNTSGRNVIHCIIYVSFMRADFEDEMIEMFRTIRQNVSLSVLRELLMQEDDCGCRPTEYAMHLGVLGIAREIFSTKGIFLTNIEYDGCGETGWFDITDYEESRKRMTRSPIVLFALLDRSRLENQHFKELFFSQAFQQWVHTKTKAARPFLFLWFVLRILFAILYYAADSALLFSEENYLMKSRQINASSCLQFSDKKATEVSSFSCITACIIYSIVMMVFEISENYLFFFHKSQLWLFQTPMGLKRMVVQVAFYKVSQLICYISVACSLTARLFRLKRGARYKCHCGPCFVFYYRVLSKLVHPTICTSFTCSRPLHYVTAKNAGQPFSFGDSVCFLCLYVRTYFLHTGKSKQNCMCSGVFNIYGKSLFNMEGFNQYIAIQIFICFRRSNTLFDTCDVRRYRINSDDKFPDCNILGHN